MWARRPITLESFLSKRYFVIFKKKVLEGEDPFEPNRRELRESYEQSLRNKKERENK